MNNKIIFSILMTSFLLQATPPQEGKPATGSFQGGTQALPWLLGAAVVTGGGHWAYNRWFSQKQPSLKEKADQAEAAFKDCLRTNTQGSMNQHNFPFACEDVAFSFIFAREALDKLQGVQTTHKIVDEFQHYRTTK